MEGIRKAAEKAILEFLDLFPMPRGSLFVLGGSTSEVLGKRWERSPVSRWPKPSSRGSFPLSSNGGYG